MKEYLYWSDLMEWGACVCDHPKARREMRKRGGRVPISEVVKYMIKNKMKSDLFWLATCSMPMLKAVLAQGVKVNARDGFKETLLHHAVRRKNYKMIQALINAGAHINTKNDVGYTPLRVAKRRPNRRIITLLEKHGAKE